MNQTILAASALAVQRGKKRLIESLDFELPRGSSLGVVGPNGVGKSSLLRILAGLDRPASGSVKVEGTVAYLPQDVNL
ncbi:MAG: ABC transporter ATP-binding protein, partial [bacterium]